MRSWTLQALRENGDRAGGILYFAYSVQDKKDPATHHTRSPWMAVW